MSNASKIQQAPTQTSLQSSGEAALVSGIYWVEHGQHISKREVFVNKGMELPTCPACNQPLEFRLIEQVACISEDPDFC